MNVDYFDCHTDYLGNFLDLSRMLDSFKIKREENILFFLVFNLLGIPEIIYIYRKKREFDQLEKMTKKTLLIYLISFVSFFVQSNYSIDQETSLQRLMVFLSLM